MITSKNYDYPLGGKDNFAEDRALGDALAAQIPSAPYSARANRAFLGRAVRYLVRERGIRQFLDIGTGIPSAGNTHEVAREPGKILANPALHETLDLAEPVALMLVSIPPFFRDDEDPRRIGSVLLDTLPSGSYLTISHIIADFIKPEQAASAVASGKQSGVTYAPRTQGESLRSSPASTWLSRAWCGPGAQQWPRAECRTVHLAFQDPAAFMRTRPFGVARPVRRTRRSSVPVSHDISRLDDYRARSARLMLVSRRQSASALGGGDHMTATLAARHHVRDYAAWRRAYEEAEPLRAQYGCTAARVMRLPDDGNDLFIIHEFPSAEQAGNFAGDPALREAMERSGVEGVPRIEIFTDA